MIRTYQNELGGWTAEYRDRDGLWRKAHDARRIPINCETEALALSVARYRRKRLRSFK